MANESIWATLSREAEIVPREEVAAWESRQAARVHDKIVEQDFRRMRAKARVIDRGDERQKSLNKRPSISRVVWSVSG